MVMAMARRDAKKLKLPLSREGVQALRAGDMALLTGEVVTGRDRLHKHLFHEKPPKEALPFNLDGMVLYHSGPIMRKSGEGWGVVAAGPTTSQRLEMYAPWVIGHYGLRAIMGKGGMGSKTLEALGKSGCVYLHTISGAASYLADRIKAVKSGWFIEEFGMAEAVWVLEVEDFPVFVTMDAHGRSLHAEIEQASLKALRELLR